MHRYGFAAPNSNSSVKIDAHKPLQPGFLLPRSGQDPVWFGFNTSGFRIYVSVIVVVCWGMSWPTVINGWIYI